MTSRAGSSRYDDRDYYDRPPPRRREDVDVYERRESVGPRREFDETQVRVRERERERDSDSRVPAFMRDDAPRRGDAGPLVLRSREVETVERPRARPRSPSPMRIVREERIVQRARSLTPPPRQRSRSRDRVEIRERVVERERVRSPSRGPVERVRPVYIERSPSRTRFVERERRRSISPAGRHIERERITIERERERERTPSPSPSPSPPPPPAPEPQYIRGPTIEREVITHYRDIDHGMIVARPPSPPPMPKIRRKERSRERELDIDIITSRNRTEVDIHDSSRERIRGRSVSRERPSPRLPPPPVHHHHHHDRVSTTDLVVHTERNRLNVDIEDRKVTTRRAHSAAPPRHHHDEYDYDSEAERITSRINERGRMGEAWHGHTKDWTIVDVPPGTERVRMDGVGGGGAEVTWQRYNGVRRAKFIPERDSNTTVTSSSSSLTLDRERERDRSLSVSIYDKGRDKDREIEVEKVTDRRVSIRNTAPPLPPPARPKQSEMWTEITKDLVTRDAIEEMGYEYEETEWFYYIMQYLRYEDVLELVKVSDDIRRHRKDRVREIQWERDYRDDWERRSRQHQHQHQHHAHFHDHRHRRRSSFDREITIDHEHYTDRGGRRYLR